MGDRQPVQPGVARATPLPPRPSVASGPAASGPVAAARPPRPEPRSRPDPNPMRLMAGFIGLASLSAIASGLLPGVTPTSPVSATTTIVTDVAALPAKHVTRYVQLKPGQTAPPQAAVVAAPKPTPRVVVVTTTRQSGKP